MSEAVLAKYFWRQFVSLKGIDVLNEVNSIMNRFGTGFTIRFRFALLPTKRADMRRTYQTEFPNFGVLDVSVPPGFLDASWHNDVMPSFERAQLDGSVLRIWINYADRSKREEGENDPRFALVWYDESSVARETLLESDDWEEIIQAADEAGKL